MHVSAMVFLVYFKKKGDKSFKSLKFIYYFGYTESSWNYCIRGFEGLCYDATKYIMFKKVQVGKDQEKAQSEKDSQWEKTELTIRYLYHENTKHYQFHRQAIKIYLSFTSVISREVLRSIPTLPPW